MTYKQVIEAGVAARTLADRVVEYFNPTRGLARLQSRTMLASVTGRGGYESGRRDRRATKRWRPGDGSADADTLLELPDLRGRSRDLRRNTPLATGAFATNATNVVGDGLSLQAAVDADVLGITPEAAAQMQREHEREWAFFCRSCDFTRVQSREELENLAYIASLESGDCFIVRRYRKDAGDLYGTKLQILEADRVSNPGFSADNDQISGGVEGDGDGVPVAYHVTNRHPGGLRVAGLKWSRLPAHSETGLPLVLHLYDRARPELTRGVPYLAPVIEAFKQLGDYSSHELTAALVSSMYTVFATVPNADAINPGVGEADPTLDEKERKLGPGAVLSLPPGYDVKFADPTRPNANFDPFVQAILRQVGVALEIPYELLIKHFTASYSASRAALEMAWQYFSRRRTWLARRFCQPVYEWMMDEAVATGRLNRPGYFADPLIRAAYLGAHWIGSRRPSLDPLKEALADEIDILKLRTKTREQVCVERTGGDFADKRRKIAEEETALAAGGSVVVLTTGSGAAAQEGSQTPGGGTGAGGAASSAGSDHEARLQAVREAMLS